MSGISDEMLMAYVDGELDDSARTAVETYLASVPEGVERLRVFEETGRGLSSLFDQPMREPVPQRLLDVVNAPADVLAFDRSKRASQRPIAMTWPIALAASLTILAAGGSAYWLASQSGSNLEDNLGVEVASSGERLASRQVASVLDTAASGTTTAVMIDSQNARIKPVYTFATASRGFCRQFMITAQDATGYGSVACKSADGRWRIEAYEALDANRSTAAGKITPASGHAGPKSVEDAVDRLIDGDVLGLEAERAVSERGWQARSDRE